MSKGNYLIGDDEIRAIVPAAEFERVMTILDADKETKIYPTRFGKRTRIAVIVKLAELGFAPAVG